MEERIIDDEYGRGIRLKKTKDGYIDVTDELAEQNVENGQEGNEEEYEEEIAFEFPVFETDEDDEDLVGLSPEEAMALRRKKEEEAKQRKEDYRRACEEGEALLSSGSFKAAELKFEKALALDDIATDASVGYWRAKTQDFKNPDVLVDEYVEAGSESLEYDLGYEAVVQIKKRYRKVFEAKANELQSEIKPLKEKVESAQQERREVLKERLKKSGVRFLCVTLPAIALLVLTIVIGFKNLTTRDNTFVVPTIILGAAFFLSFIFFMIYTNKFINVLRLWRANGKIEATEEGARLIALQEYEELYAWLASVEEVEEEEEIEQEEA
jgi:hypothetical protein